MTAIDPDIVQWITSFLQNGKICLQMRNKMVTRTISDGLPQGDVLSPTLFNIYTRELHGLNTEDVILVQFADDFGILVKGKNLAEVNENAQAYLNRFIEATKKLHLEVNPDKTKAILFQNNDKTLDVSISGEPIETVRNHKCLGIILDRYMSFGVHIKDVRTKVQDRLNMMKVLSGARSGAHPDTMVRIYKALCRSVMEYACSTYNNARKTNRNLLIVANNQCLRKITGATRSTPLNVLSALSGQEPLELRHEFVTAKEIARNISRDTVVAKQLQKVDIPITEKENYSYMETVYAANFEIMKRVRPLTAIEIEESVEINAYLDRVHTSKRNCNPTELKMNVLFNMNGKNKGRGRIFTDASKEGKRCGIGVFIETSNQRYSIHLKQEVSITSAELLAIQFAVARIEEQQLYNQIIYTDSRSACVMLESAQQSREDEKILKDILRACQRWKVSIQWIPSHIDIHGNEVADQLAKLGLTSNDEMDNNILLQDALFLLKQSLSEKTNGWYTEYSVEKGRNFLALQTTFNPKPWFYKINLKGKEIKLINRLMSGHDFSKPWLVRMKLNSDPNCEDCGTPETAEHLILHCPRYDRLRRNYKFDNQFRTLPDLLKTVNVNIFREVNEFVVKANITL